MREHRVLPTELSPIGIPFAIDGELCRIDSIGHERSILSHSSSSLSNALGLGLNESAHTPAQNPMSCSERYQHRSHEHQMIEARKERVRDLIRSLESVQVRRRALDEDRAFEGPTETGMGKSSKMQRIPRAKSTTTRKAPSIT